MPFYRSLPPFAAGLLTLAVLAGCSTPPRYIQRATVIDRTAPADRSASASASASVDTDTGKALPPGWENAGKPGYYTVRPGDTLIRIGLETGQSWRDLQAWNAIANPNRIEVGQVIRVVPPLGGVPVVTASPVSNSHETAPAERSPASAATPSPIPTVTANAPATSGASSGASTAVGSATASPQTAAPSAATTKPPATPVAGEQPDFIWPVSAVQIIDAFDEARNKGVDIGGRAGEPVLAAADGKVVYAGSGLRGYGNLVILKHSHGFLSAYAHNQALMVAEDQSVRKGQKIAEMGSSDANRVKLHFEVRYQGRPVDPLKYLPSR